MAQRLQSMDELFKCRHFEREVIVLCVRWYLRFKLSFRDREGECAKVWEVERFEALWPRQVYALTLSSTRPGGRNAPDHRSSN